ncbi:FMN-binding glutamate synthase family protein [candidate division WOR-3 bacterium]|uniref:FMN-binding glutamate synthase family protein n=1 Tax=candidate division WOR-3 bacterium TaxID=2052148 RepID=A0A937XF48_UNCW3|nr:FMN-binding glutamate synthase family protein [candidate division WOR-3 bacterium]
MCVTCVDGCVGMCEIGKSAYRGHECIYPQPFGIITAASEKDYPVDYSHFTILGTAVGAHGIEASSDKAVFPNVVLEQKFGHDKGIKVKLPIAIGGMGSTNVAAINWEGLAGGAAISGVILTVGENVCGMDPKSEIKNGRVVSSPELKRRVDLFRKWQRDGYGEVVVQSNVEDTTLGTLEYAIEKLGVRIVELKWGQGAKDIGGEVKIKDLKKAQMLYERGYVVLPNPTDPDVIKAFESGSFKEFERHSRVGMVTEQSFMERVAQLRKAGAKYVFLKTGAYRPADLARAVKFASKAKLDMLTVDGAGGGTGMSPWRMMNEWGVPPVELHSLLYQYCAALAQKGEHIPMIAPAGGFTFEDHMFKALALCAPYAGMVAMARGPLCAAMVGKTIGIKVQQGDIPVYIERFGNTAKEIFVTTPELRKHYGADFDALPTGAIGVYTYFERLAQGLRQLMAGERKFNLSVMSRDDIASLTPECAKVSGIPHIMDVDKAESEAIING